MGRRARPPTSTSPGSTRPAEKIFEDELQRDIYLVNDADAAGMAEVQFGAAKGHPGLVLMTTLGTGIGRR